MTTFVIGKPVATAVPEVVVDAGLPVGKHRFQLVVVDSSGNTSKAAEVVVQVGRVIVNPTGPFTPVRPVTPVRRGAQPATSRRKKT